MEQKKITDTIDSIEVGIERRFQKLSHIQALKISDARPSDWQSKGEGKLMAGDEFEKVELPAIEKLQSLGWSYVKGEDLSR